MSGGSLIDWHDKAVLKEVGNVVETATEEGAKIVAAAAKGLVPVRTGALRDSIKVKPSRFEDGGHLVQAQGSGDYDKFYAIFVELGLKKTRNMKARPYLRPALHQSKRKILKLFDGKLK